MADVVGRQELPLLDVDHATGGGGRQKEVRLPREKGRNLKDIRHLRDRGGLGGVMDIGQDRETEVAFHLGQHWESLVQTGTAKRLDRRSIGLIEGGLENQGDAAVGSDFLDGAGGLDGVSLTLDHARSGDQSEWLVLAERHVPDGYLTHGASIAAGLVHNTSRPTTASRLRLRRRVDGQRSRNQQRGGAGGAVSSGIRGGTAPPTNHGWSDNSSTSTNFPSGDLPDTRRPASVRLCSNSRLNSYR